MKRYFFIGIAVILALAVALVGYGAWLNYMDEKQIAVRMEERAVELTGARAEVRSLHPTVEMEAARLYYDDSLRDSLHITDTNSLRS